MRPIKTLSRDWIRVTGPDSLRFLNGMWTCDFKRAVNATKNSGESSTGAGLLLNVKGRAVGPAVFLCTGEQEFWLSIPAGSGDAVYTALDHLLVADEVEMTRPEEAPWTVMALPKGMPGVQAEAEIPAPVPEAKDKLFRAVRIPQGLRVPRAQLGERHEELWLAAGQSLPFAARELSADGWSALRVEAGIPEWGVDYDGENLVLEFPFAAEISFHKGCYIGQEVVARGTYRGKMNKGFARFTADAPLQLGFVHSEADTSKPVAKITTVAGTKGLGLLRLAVTGALYQESANGRIPVRSVDVLT